MVWPLDLQQDGLNITFGHVQHMIGREIGLDREPDLWDTEETEVVQEIIDLGTRWAYFPAPLDQPYNKQDVHHQWTWMRPDSQLITVSNQQSYPLPSDFDYLIGRPAYDRDDDNTYLPLDVVSPDRLRELANQRRYISAPEVCATDSSASFGDGPQEQLILLHPIPDSTYTLNFKYQSTGPRLTTERPYPLGGPANAGMFLAACLAAAEFRHTGNKGAKWEDYQTELKKAFDRDNRRGARIIGDGIPPNIAGRGTLRRSGGLYYKNVLYEGTQY